MPRDFLILCDTDGNQVKKITLEMLSRANALAQVEQQMLLFLEM